MAKYSHDSIVPFKDSGLGKKQQIAQMFDRIAFRYDFLNRFLSGGIDIYWRKRAIRELKLLNPLKVLDVATGTADMAIMMTRHLPDVRVTGIDISTGMLEMGRQKIAKLKLEDQVELMTGDSEAIQFPDHSFDAVTVAFGVRNFENLEKGLREILRVLRPGGRLVVLEFSQPKMGIFRKFYDLYLRVIAPGISAVVSSNREAYQYLNDSVRAFPEGEDFVQILDKNGYIRTSLKSLSMCICTVYTGEKAAN
ncbi:bifunctional demethylmenaquinone methyltransferase/2-methoxy-6-polyprenyl-1,4-benzoquinol methylase UbiE [Flavitalea flava]